MRSRPPNAENGETAKAYAQFAPRVRRTLRLLGVREPDVQDVCHDVFVVVQLRSATLKEIGSMGLWLQAISRRAAAGYRRSSRCTREILVQDPAATRADQTAPDWRRSDWRDDERAVRDAFTALDEECRTVLSLHDINEISISRMAAMLGRDRKTLRKRLAIARRRFAVLIGATGKPGRSSSAAG